MKRRMSIVYGAICLLPLIGGFLGTFYMLWSRSIPVVIAGLVCMISAFMLTPAMHELGHVVFARFNGMKIVYLKFSCFSWKRTGKKLRFALTNPFSADETQAVPTFGGNMKRRAKAYTLGGLIVSFIFLLVCVLLALCVPNAPYLWGLVPAPAYLFLLNVVPADYPAGLTDMAIYVGVCKDEPAQTNMLSAMEIQGRLFAGQSYAEIDKELYCNVPTLAEDEPLFAVMLDLRYRYYLELEDLENATKCLNRLVGLQEYLSDAETERMIAELTYMHALNGDYERASECGKLCERYLSGADLSAKRVLCTYTYAFGDKEKALQLRNLALEEVREEWISGHAKSEKKLLLRMNKTLTYRQSLESNFDK